MTIKLNAAEVTALLEIARQECRHPREQARFMLRAELQRLGLLAAIDQQVSALGSQELEEVELDT